MRWLVDEWNHRDPQDLLHDIDCGRYLQELHRLPQSLRQLLENNDLYVELREIDNKYKVVKIIKKREAEFLQGTERYFVYDNKGQHIVLSEDEFDELLNIQHNPEELFEQEDIEFQTLNSEYTAPMDVWDLVFDASEYVKEAEKFVTAWNEDRLSSSLIHFQSPEKHLKEMQETGIYSADWFPYAADKKLHSNKAKRIAKAILDKDLTKAQLGAMIGPKEPDTRVRAAQTMKNKAKYLKKGKEKGELLVKAQKLLLQVSEEYRKGKQVSLEPPISNSDRNKLWSLWKEKTIETQGKIQLMPWQFERWYKIKLQRETEPKFKSIEQLEKDGILTRDEALIKIKTIHNENSQKLTDRMIKIYSQKPASDSIFIEDFKRPELSQLEISWLKNSEESFATIEDIDILEPNVLVEEDYQVADWLPNAFFLDNEVPIQEEEWEMLLDIDIE
jgi:hypothetical protein